MSEVRVNGAKASFTTSGEPLAALFDTWLHQPSKPEAPAAGTVPGAAQAVAPVPPRWWRRIAATNGVPDHDHGQGRGR
ncbi:hypothetical protein FHS33_000295 [Streptomyces calvus]|uniref:Uncharacterized protein n=1 Tax=Streptomyces calvus TaxID=67282 RepID=A0AA40S8J3_9ACTN|nr:hypothetical protein [Streptomyces calvus]MBA8941906.1 hypothetical protein [Streptomyces calvus]